MEHVPVLTVPEFAQAGELPSPKLTSEQLTPLVGHVRKKLKEAAQIKPVTKAEELPDILRRELEGLNPAEEEDMVGTIHQELIRVLNLEQGDIAQAEELSGHLDTVCKEVGSQLVEEQVAAKILNKETGKGGKGGLVEENGKWKGKFYRPNPTNPEGPLKPEHIQEAYPGYLKALRRKIIEGDTEAQKIYDDLKTNEAVRVTYIDSKKGREETITLTQFDEMIDKEAQELWKKEKKFGDVTWEEAQEKSPFLTYAYRLRAERQIDSNAKYIFHQIKKEEPQKSAKPKPETPLSPEQQTELEAAIKEAQEFLSAEKGEFGYVTLDKDVKSPNRVLMHMIRFTGCVDPSYNYAGQLTSMGLELAKKQLNLIPETPENREKIQKRREKLNEHLAVLKKLPGQEQGPRELIQTMAQHMSSIPVKYWNDRIDELAQIQAKGGDITPIINGVIDKVFEAGSQHPDSSEQLQEMFESMVPEEKRESLFNTKKIIKELESHDDYEDYMKNKKPKDLKERLKKSLLFTEEEKSIKGILMLFGYAAFMIMQLLEGADKQAAAAGTGGQGGEAPAG